MIPSLESFYSAISNIDLSKKNHLVLCQVGDKFVPCDSSKIEAGYRKLRLLEIVILSKQCLKEPKIATDPMKLKTILATMGTRKAKNAYGCCNFLGGNFLFIRQLFSMLANAWNGFGFKTSADLALELANNCLTQPVKHYTELRTPPLTPVAPSTPQVNAFAGCDPSSPLIPKELPASTKSSPAPLSSPKPIPAHQLIAAMDRSYYQPLTDSEAFKDSTFSLQGKMIPIYLDRDMITGTYLDASRYRNEILPEQCGAVKAFVYYADSFPIEYAGSESDVKDRVDASLTLSYYQNEGWGESWLSGLNQINKVIIWLHSQNIQPLLEYDRFVTMEDLAVVSQLQHGTPISSADVLEMMYRVFKIWYSEKDYGLVSDLFKPTISLYLDKDTTHLAAIQTLLRAQVARNRKSVSNQHPYSLTEMNKLLWGECVEYIARLPKIAFERYQQKLVKAHTSSKTMVPSNSVPVNPLQASSREILTLILEELEEATKMKQIKQDALQMVKILTFMNEITYDNISEYWVTLMALQRLYSKTRVMESDATVFTNEDFPQLNEESVPIPFSVHDLQNRSYNIFGTHTKGKDNQKAVSHLFVTRLTSKCDGPVSSPWIMSGWMPASSLSNKTFTMLQLPLDTSFRPMLRLRAPRKEEAVKSDS